MANGLLIWALLLTTCAWAGENPHNPPGGDGGNRVVDDGSRHVWVCAMGWRCDGIAYINDDRVAHECVFDLTSTISAKGPQAEQMRQSILSKVCSGAMEAYSNKRERFLCSSRTLKSGYKYSCTESDINFGSMGCTDKVLSKDELAKFGRCIPKQMTGVLYAD